MTLPVPSEVKRKGFKGELCNVTRCQKPEAYFLNKGNSKYYCRSCAADINWEGGREDTKKLFGVPLLCEVEVGSIKAIDDKELICMWDDWEDFLEDEAKSDLAFHYEEIHTELNIRGLGCYCAV